MLRKEEFTIATIRTSIQIHDAMSQQFRAMNMAMSTVIDSFDKLQDATGKAVDVSALRSAQHELQRVEASYDQIEDEIRQATQQQERLNNAVSAGSSLIKGLGGAILGFVTAYASFQSIEKLLNMADAYTGTTARISMMNDGLQTTAELQEKIYQAAQNSYSSYNDMADMVAKLGNNAASAFDSTAEIVDFAELVQKQFSIAGASVVESSNAALQLTQALGSGVLRGDELNSIFEQAPNLIQNIANYLDVPIGAIREMASEGEITAEIVKASMFAAADDINRKFDSMPKSWGDAWTEMSNYAQKQMSSVFHRISDFIGSDTFATLQQAAMQAFDVIVAGLNYVIWMLTLLGEAAASTIQFFQEYRAIFEPIAIVLGVIAASIGAIFIWLGVVRVATLLWAAAQWVVNTAYLSNPITWVLIAIISIIALIIYAVTAWGEQTATVLGYVYKGFAALGVGIYNILIGIANVAIVVAEFFVNTWNKGLHLAHMGWIYFNLGVRAVLDAIGNAVFSAAEWIANTFNDCVYGVQMAFYKMAQMVMKILGGVADGAYSVVNKVLGAISNLINGAISGVNSFIGLLNGVLDTDISTIGTVNLQLGSGSSNISSTLQGLISEPTRPERVTLNRFDSVGDYLSDLNVPTAPEAVTFNRIEYADMGAAMDSAFDYAYNGTMALSDSLNGLVDKAKGFLNYEVPEADSSLQSLLDGTGLGGTEYGVPDLASALDDGAGKIADAVGKGSGAGRKTAANTKKLADSVDMAVEDLEYLRDLAERESINRYTTGEINIDMSGMQNNIDNELDIDGVIDRFAEKLEEAVEIVAEGGGDNV